VLVAVAAGQVVVLQVVYSQQSLGDQAGAVVSIRQVLVQQDPELVGKASLEE